MKILARPFAVSSRQDAKFAKVNSFSLAPFAPLREKYSFVSFVPSLVECRF